MAKQDDFAEKCLEGFNMFALNQGEICTCPSRALIQASIYDEFLHHALERTGRIKQGNPLDTETMVGAQVSNDQREKILSYLEIGRQEGAKVLIGGKEADVPADLQGGYYIEPTIFRGRQQDAHLSRGDLRPRS